ncbi:MAG TPA: hypothetical protein VJT75_16320 [Thermoleophilaceae bacterium]|nr:hypothetical protein [Thermoleophilaceae bacterium]
MPTLQPQRLSGLVVTPTVELEGNIYRASIAIDVGVSRTGLGSTPPEEVAREDLVVELRHPTEGSFEPIASPDPGALPVRAIRVVQARGEFTYGQGVNAPAELVVTLRGDQGTFPLTQTLARTGCLRREPEEGHPFPRTRPKGLIAAIRGLPSPLLRRRCCPDRFDAPVNAIADAAVKSESFEIEADFVARARQCRCGCCEYRQFVRGTFTDAAGAAVRFDMPSGALDPARYCEDGAIDEFGAGSHGFYGHRDTSSPGDEYGAPHGNRGCDYRGNETPSCPPADAMHLEFLGLIVDRCRQLVVAKRQWVVDL